MARVNDGNLLQHFTECALVDALAARDGLPLRLVATHAMAPFEPARDASAGDTDRRMRAVLARAADGPGGTAEPPLLRALGATAAAPARYPDTAELVAALVGRARLAGVLCEVEAEARLALEAAWRGSAVRVEGEDWRAVCARGALFPPEDLDRPWLVTMDPYTWLLDGEVKKEARGPYLLRFDLEAIRPVLSAHVRSGRPGAATVFVYGLDPLHAKHFRAHVLRLADRLRVERALLGVAGRDGTRHVGAVLSPVEGLAPDVAAAWDRFLHDADAWASGRDDG